MVLLTSSTVSVLLSSGIICLFTFLLFLSGYMLQRNAVDNLRSALEAPLEVRVRVQPTLPPQFQQSTDDSTFLAEDDNDTAPALAEVFASLPRSDSAQITIGESRKDITPPQHSTAVEPSPQELWHAHVDGSPVEALEAESDANHDGSYHAASALDGRFAYVLSLPLPSQLCSAMLFAKWQRQFSALSTAQVNIIFLYPADWESSSHPIHTDTLRLLLEAEHDHSVILHPVPISKVWTGIDIESQLLSELARNPWPYDRAMYLQLPGMLIDTTRLDATLTSTYNDISLIKTSWAKLRAPNRRGGATVRRDVLLFAQGKGLMSPVGHLAQTLTAEAKTSHANHHHDEVKDEFLAKEAAYILFDEEEVKHRRTERLNHQGIFERFERERGLVCEGTSLLA